MKKKRVWKISSKAKNEWQLERRKRGRESEKKMGERERERGEVTGVEGRLTKMMILSIYIQDANCRT